MPLWLLGDGHCAAPHRVQQAAFKEGEERLADDDVVEDVEAQDLRTLDELSRQANIGRARRWIAGRVFVGD